MKILPTVWAGGIAMRAGILFRSEAERKKAIEDKEAEEKKALEDALLREKQVADVYNPPEAMRTYSSVYDKGYDLSMLDSETAWMASSNNLDQWIVIDAGKAIMFKGVMMQKQNNAYNKVT